MNDAEKMIVEIRQAMDTFAYEKNISPYYSKLTSTIEKILDPIDKILDPPKPKGWIGNDLPEVGTVYEFASGAKRKLVCIHDNRILVVFDYSNADTGGRIDPIEMSVDKWNRLSAPNVTAVHPPAGPERPKVHLSRDGNKEVRIISAGKVTFVSHRKSQNCCVEKLQKVLESAKDADGKPLIEVEVVE